MSGQSRLCDGLCAKTPLWSKPRRGWGIFVCGKKDCGGVHCVCISVCLLSRRATPSLYRWWTHLGTGSWCKTSTEGEAKWVSLWMSERVCVCVFQSTGVKPKPYLTFWLSMPPREPLGLGLGLQTQNKDKMKTANKSLCFYTLIFLCTV